jgi:hypothetical protein
MEGTCENFKMAPQDCELRAITESNCRRNSEKGRLSYFRLSERASNTGLKEHEFIRGNAPREEVTREQEKG